MLVLANPLNCLESQSKKEKRYKRKSERTNT